jgi:VacB/RNase II family 3'-5' exoribonuclease
MLFLENKRGSMSGTNDLRRIARQAMLHRGFLPDFSAAALQQSASIGTAPRAAEPAIRDLRALLWLSIDNDESRDLDQVSVARPLADNATQLLVGIADVDALVERGSPVDDHARTNTTSIYTAAQIFPMLPERLSTNLTSLADRQERLAVVVEMTVMADGSITDTDVYRALVFNHARLAYNDVSNWLDDKAPAPAAISDSPELQQQIRIQEAASERLRKVRHALGAMRLETIQAETVFTNGGLSDLRPATKNRAKELVEDQMIAANGVTARFLEYKGLASLRRVLQTPKRWDRIVALAANYGERLPSTPDVVALSAFLQRRRQADPARYADISLSIIKMLGSGEYGVDVPGRRVEGHFGLAVSDYTHSTAPNRRFPDLVTQRLVKAAIAGDHTPYSEEELNIIARHCTEREDEAAKVERQVRKSAAAMLLESHIGREFDAIVTGAADKGTWVRINKPVAEGRVVRGAQGLDVGDHVRVKLLGVDIERGFIDFATDNSAKRA